MRRGKKNVYKKEKDALNKDILPSYFMRIITKRTAVDGESIVHG